jgi:hypothetical protein
LSDSPEETRNGGPTAGTKRLYSNRESKHSAYHYDENGELEDADRELHSGKRYRGSDWPLSRPIDPNPSNASSPKALTRNRNGASSPLQPRRSTSLARPSKFLEGSMNDRVSQMPPPNYVGDEEYLRGTYEEYEHDDLGNITDLTLLVIPVSFDSESLLPHLSTLTIGRYGRNESTKLSKLPRRKF